MGKGRRGKATRIVVSQLDVGFPFRCFSSLEWLVCVSCFFSSLTCITRRRKEGGNGKAKRRVGKSSLSLSSIALHSRTSKYTHTALEGDVSVTVFLSHPFFPVDNKTWLALLFPSSALAPSASTDPSLLSLSGSRERFVKIAPPAARTRESQRTIAF